MDINASAFDFRRKPFSLRFDSEFFWTNARFDIIYNHLLNGIRQHQGVMALTGEAGTGKTFMLRQLMQTAGVDIHADTRFVFCNYFSSLDFDDLLDLICEELGSTPQGSGRLYKLKALSEYLNSNFKKGVSTALLIDEAHNLDEDVVSHLVTLSRSGFKDGRSLQILLSGLPLLGEKLTYWKTIHPIMANVPENRLEPLTASEVADFIRHQLEIAGGPNKDLFPEPVLESIACHARVPRLINMFCDRALLIAQDANETCISREIINDIADEILSSEPTNHKPLKSVIDSLSDVKATEKIDELAETISLDTPSEKDNLESQSVVQTLELSFPNSTDIAKQPPLRRRGRIWVALFLLISVGATGGYALQQRYGSEGIAVAAEQALAFVNTQWSSLSSKIQSFAQTLKSEPSQPPAVPEIIQDTPPLSGAGGITETAVAELPSTVAPAEPRTDSKLISQPERSAELAGMASVPQPPIQLAEISTAAQQALEVLENQWSSLTSKMIAKAQALKPDTHLPLPTPDIVRDTPPEPRDIDIIETAAPEVLQADPFEPRIDITPKPRPEPATEIADIASVAEAPLEGPTDETHPATDPLQIEHIQTAAVALEIQTYMRKGDEFFGLSDLIAARLYYDAALKAGYTAALVAVGKTYDPLMLQTLGMGGTYAEPIKAAEWYRKALQAGIPEATERLDELQHWLAASPPLKEADRIILQQLLQP